jgi:uncharacterized membrane protein YcaP (DUF421 family)
MEPIVFFFDGWEPVLRVAFIGVAGYLTLVLLLRLSGKRTMARMNTFDFVITVTLGAAFGRVLTTRDVGYLELVTAFAVLIGLQLLVSWLRVHVAAVGRVVDSAPTLLYYRGRFLNPAMRRERITGLELRTRVRQQGLGSFADVEAIVMEANGELAVIPRDAAGDGAELEPLRRSSPELA